MSKRLAILLAASTAVASCAVTYTLDGQRYTSSEDFQRAGDTHITAALASIAPLRAPLTTRKLIFAIPSEQALYQENVRRATLISGHAPMGPANDMVVNLTRSNWKLTKIYYDAVQKKGIYASAQFREMPGMAVSIEPSTDTDVLYYTEPSQGAGQWFYSSLKHGKQVFAYDRSVSSGARVNAFVDAVQAQAIRE